MFNHPLLAMMDCKPIRLCSKSIANKSKLYSLRAQIKQNLGTRRGRGVAYIYIYIHMYIYIYIYIYILVFLCLCLCVFVSLYCMCLRVFVHACVSVPVSLCNTPVPPDLAAEYPFGRIFIMRNTYLEGIGLYIGLPLSSPASIRASDPPPLNPRMLAWELGRRKYLGLESYLFSTVPSLRPECSNWVALAAPHVSSSLSRTEHRKVTASRPSTKRWS